MSIIFPNGEKEITVASGSKLAVSSGTAVKIYKKTGYANLPDTWALSATTTAGTEYLSPAMSAATVFRVGAGAAIANYATGVVPVVASPLSGGQLFSQQTAASAEADGAQAITASQMINGIVVHTVTTGRTLTTPTGAVITAACPSSLAAGDTFRLHVVTIGTGADDISTLTAGDGDVTFVGNVTVGPDASTFNGYGTFLFRYSGSNAWVGYRVG